MSNDNTENETPENEEEVQPNEQDESKTVEELTKELEESKEYGNNQKIRAEKAEKLKGKEEKTETPKKEDKDTKSDEPDYNDRLDRLSLKSEGITNSDDQDLVLKEAKRLDLSVEDILKEDYMKGKLKTLSTQREAEAGMPDGSGKKGGGTKNSVEYWVDRTNKDGAYENPVNDPDLTIKVVNARMEKERKKQEFPD